MEQESGGGGRGEWPGRHRHGVAVTGMSGIGEELGTDLGPGVHAWLSS